MQQEKMIGTVDLSDLSGLHVPDNEKRPSNQTLSARERIASFIALFGVNVETQAVRHATQSLSRQYSEYGVLRPQALTTLSSAVTPAHRNTVVEKFRAWQRAFELDCRVMDIQPSREGWQRFLKEEASDFPDEIWRTFMKEGTLVYDIEPSEMHIGYSRQSGILTLAGPYGAANIRLDNNTAIWA